jgi:glycine cleavage system H protein
MFPRDLGYTKQDEWIRRENGVFSVGITEHAAKQLGDITYLELPELKRVVSQGEEVAVVESVKAVSDVFAPVGGRVMAVNAVLTDHPETVNASPYGEGWIFKLDNVDPSELAALMTADEYAALVAELKD